MSGKIKHFGSPPEIIYHDLVSAEEDKVDMVNHPPHYSGDPSGVECIEITRHRNFNVGNAIKYLWRSGLKGAATSGQQIEDLQKSVWYIEDEIFRLTELTKREK